MEYAKIIVKSNYEKKGDLVLRSYIRALRKINANKLLDGDNAFIYGVVCDDGYFHELYTNTVIDYDNYTLASLDEIYDADDVTDERRELLKRIMDNVLFNKKNDIDFEISSMEDLARDRAIEFDAYDRFLSRVNPYMRLSSNISQDAYNGYNNFLYKISELKKGKKLSSYTKNIDFYSIYDYVLEPKEETEEEYLVFEVPKKLIKK